MTCEPQDQLNPQPDDHLQLQGLVWTVLLGRWIDFAKSAVVLPDDPSSRRLRKSVPDLIMLQAVWYALKNLEELDIPERDLGLDRAQVLIDKHAQLLEDCWPAAELPRQVREIILDTRAALYNAQNRVFLDMKI